MKYCETCGNQLTDNAVFCPKCGSKVGDNNKKVPTMKKNSQNQNESLSTWQKIALGVTAFVAFTGIVGGFADGMWIVGLLSLCAMGVVCAVFMGLIEKKYAWTSAIVSFLVVMCAIGASAPDDEKGKQEQVQTELKQETPEEKQAREKKEQAEKQAQEKQEKIKKVAEVAYNLGYETRKKTWGQQLSSQAAAEADYRFRYAEDPEDAGQSERWKVFRENYVKGFADCANDIIKKHSEEDF